MIKYALIDEESKVIDLLEVLDRDTLDGYVLPEHQCALIYINNMETPSIGQVWNSYENKFI
jgi:hypothetical protein